MSKFPENSTLQDCCLDSILNALQVPSHISRDNVGPRSFMTRMPPHNLIDVPHKLVPDGLEERIEVLCKKIAELGVDRRESTEYRACVEELDNLEQESAHEILKELERELEADRKLKALKA